MTVYKVPVVKMSYR